LLSGYSESKHKWGKWNLMSEQPEVSQFKQLSKLNKDSNQSLNFYIHYLFLGLDWKVQLMIRFFSAPALLTVQSESSRCQRTFVTDWPDSFYRLEKMFLDRKYLCLVVQSASWEGKPAWRDRDRQKGKDGGVRFTDSILPTSRGQCSLNSAVRELLYASFIRLDQTVNNHDCNV